MDTPKHKGMKMGYIYTTVQDELKKGSVNKALLRSTLEDNTNVFITARKLAVMCNFPLSKTQVLLRKAITELIEEEGMSIISSSKGFKLCNDPEQIECYLDSLHSRIQGIQRRMRSLGKHIGNCEVRKMEEQEQTKIVDVNHPVDEVGVGEDIPQVEPKRVKIHDYEIVDVMKDGKKIGDKLVLKVEHPDMQEGLEISGVKYLFKEKVKTSGLWINMDKNTKIAYNSALAHLLRSMGVEFIKDLKGKEVDTTTDDGGYLVVKAY